MIWADRRKFITELTNQLAIVCYTMENLQKKNLLACRDIMAILKKNVPNPRLSNFKL